MFGNELNYDKIKALILHLVAVCQHEVGGVTLTKLYKLLYFIDFGHYALYGQSITNLKYLKFKYGPVPLGLNNYLELIQNQEKEAVIFIRSSRNEFGVQENFYTQTNQDLDPTVFSPTELETIKKTIAHFKSSRANQASKETHYHPSWIVTSNGSVISYEIAKSCDFEWLGYLANGKTTEEMEELKKERHLLENNPAISSLMERIKSI